MLCESLRRSCEPTVPRNYECRSRGRGGAKEIAVSRGILAPRMVSSRISTEARGRKSSPVLAGSSSSPSRFNRSIFVPSFPAFPPHFLRARPSLCKSREPPASASRDLNDLLSMFPYLSLSLCSDPSIALFPFPFGGQDSLASLVAINQPTISKKHFVVRQPAGFMVQPFARVHADIAINPTGPEALVTFPSSLPFSES